MHFIAVLMPQSGGGWRAHFPDFPGCRAEGSRIEIAIANASRAVAKLIAELHGKSMSLPAPRSFEDLRADTAWTTERAIDWATAVICLVPINLPAPS
jgi:predicted RNase H-like HicB family nuclease